MDTSTLKIKERLLNEML